MKTQHQTTMRQRVPYGIYFFGQGLIYTLVSQYLIFYYTDYVLLPSLVISVIMFGGKLWDAVNDTLFGLIMDRVRFKSGNRFIPWLKAAAVAIPLTTIFAFSVDKVPGMVPRTALAILSYLLWDLAYTMSDAPIMALATTMTPVVKERGILMTFSGIGGAAAMALSSIVLPLLFDKFGFLTASASVSVIALFAMSLVTIFCKEKFHVHTAQDTNADGSRHQPTLRETWQYIRQNRYLLMFYGYRLVSGIISVSMLTHMAKYCLGDVKYVSLVALYSIPMIVLVYIASPFILKRLDKIVIYRACMIITTVMYILTYLIGYDNKQLVVAAMAVIAALAILPAIIMGAIPQDCIEYGTFKTGIRMEGITFALQSFVNKLIAAFAAANSGIIFHLIHYDAQLPVQPDATVSIIWASTLLLPMLGQLLGIGFLFAYKLKDKDVQLMSDANRGNITRAQAMEKMSRTYK